MLKLWFSFLWPVSPHPLPFADGWMLHSNSHNFVNTPELPQTSPPGPHKWPTVGPESQRLQGRASPHHESFQRSSVLHYRCAPRAGWTIYTPLPLHFERTGDATAFCLLNPHIWSNCSNPWRYIPMLKLITSLVHRFGMQPRNLNGHC